MKRHPINDEAAELRRRFVEDVKTGDRINGIYGVYTVARENAQKAFVNWTYQQIACWASENGLMVDFGREGILNLFDSEALSSSEKQEKV